MTKDTARYIWYCMQKDSVYSWGLSDWCGDRAIDPEDYLELESMVNEMINKMEETNG